MGIIDQMKEQDITIGNRLEVMLYKGAQYDSGMDCPAGACPQPRFELGETAGQEAGISVIGYLYSYHEEYRLGIILASGWDRERKSALAGFDGGNFYRVDEKVIHSFKRI